MVKIVHDELVELMGGQSVDINLKGSPAIILMSGLQGSGKTTFAGKLANRLKTKQGKTRFWLPAMYTGLQLLNSYAFWALRSRSMSTPMKQPKIRSK